MIWLLIASTVLATASVVLALVFEGEAIATGTETISDKVQPWVRQHPAPAWLITFLGWAFLLWVTLHFFGVIP
jgi:hypothetical protein